ncbi:Fic/DOC family N-terminal domain-containing protein [Azospirillum argentinense]
MRDPYLLSRVLTRREAVSSSGIEGTHSTLDERLVVEDTEVDHFAPPTSRHIPWGGLAET